MSGQFLKQKKWHSPIGPIFFFLIATAQLSHANFSSSLVKKNRGLNPTFTSRKTQNGWIIRGTQALNEYSSGQPRVSHYRWESKKPLTSLESLVVPLNLTANSCDNQSKRSFVRYLVGGFFLQDERKAKVFAGVGIGKFSDSKPFGFAAIFAARASAFVLGEYRPPLTPRVDIYYFNRIQTAKLKTPYRLKIDFHPEQKRFDFFFEKKKSSYEFPDKWKPLVAGQRRDSGIGLFSPHCSGEAKNEIEVLVKHLKMN